MSVFEPDITRAIIKSALPEDEHACFEKEWTESVNDHVETWEASNSHAEEAASHAQFTWIAHVVAYVEFLYSRTKPPPRSASKKLLPLKLNVPIYGPQFVPPQYLHIVRRTPSTKVPKVRIEVTYLKPINLIHPFYHAPRLSVCPRCRGNNMSWDSWTSTGPRTVYGVRRPEMALGYQVRCQDCKKERANLPLKERNTIQYLYTTTSDMFWESWEYWKIPHKSFSCGLPVFFHKCAVTRDLLDLVIELRLSTTSGGLAENIKQLHLLKYHQAVLDFLDTYKQYSVCDYTDVTLDSFSTFNDPDGWNGCTISGDSITTILLQNSSRMRCDESSNYLKTLTAVSISVDATFESTKKAVVTSRSLVRSNPSGGGLFSGINELDEILFWQLSQTMSNAEIIEALDGLKTRHLVLEKPLPEVATADNCCHVRNAIVSVFPEIHVVLDVYHFLMRYAVAIVNGKWNIWYWAIIEDVREAILFKKADKDSKAVYRTKDQQELRLNAAYMAWSQHGGVWTAAAIRVHENQMNHVKKGCLARHRQDIATDGSRIEGTHKGWNSIMRSHACGLAVFVALRHDFVLQQNVRVAIVRREPPEFIASSEGSHHLRLVDHIAKLWNSLIDTRRRNGYLSPGLVRLPRLPNVASGESFGVVRSVDAESYGGLLRMKEESLKANLMEMVDESEVDIQSVSSELHIEPALFLREDVAPVRTLVQSTSIAGSSRAANTTKRPSPSPKDDSTVAICERVTTSHESHAAAFNSKPSGGTTSATPVPTSPGANGCQSGGTEMRSSSRDDVGPSAIVDLTLDDSSGAKTDDVQCSEKRPTQAPRARALKRKAEAPGALADPDRPVKKAQFLDSQSGLSAKKQSKIVIQGTQLGHASHTSSTITNFFGHCKLPSQTGQASDNTPFDLEPPRPSATQGSTASQSSGVPCPASPAHVPSSTAGTAATANASSSAAAADIRAGVGRNSRARNSSAVTSSRGAVVSPAVVQTTALTSPLPIPSSPAGLTHTEHIWTFLTAMDVRSMTIERSGGEFLVFMDLHAEQQWSMASMTPCKWVAATQAYNVKLHAWYNEKNLLPPVLKHPRALVDQLDVTEDRIITRILKDDYKSQPINGQEGTETFWRSHCHAVPGMMKDGATPKRQPQKCRHCRILKYMTGVCGASNHRCDCCSDGVRSRIEGDRLPPWLQPAGIFENGTTFNVPAFFNAVCMLYDHTVLRQLHTVEVPLEYQALGLFLMERLIVTKDGAVLFPLYEHITVLKPEPQQLPPGLLIELSGKRCLKVPQLSHDNGGGSTVTQFFSAPGVAAADTGATAAATAMAAVDTTAAVAPVDVGATVTAVTATAANAAATATAAATAASSGASTPPQAP